MIPIYTTDSMPVDGGPPVTHAWPVWAEATDLGQCLEMIARSAAARGGHAIIGLRVSTLSNGIERDRYVLIGTAVTLGG